jgi:hypothetical protein
VFSEEVLRQNQTKEEEGGGERSEATTRLSHRFGWVGIEVNE